MRSPLLEHSFPDLADWGYEVTSDPTYDYNCIAWAAGDTTQWWWPPEDESNQVHWPSGVRREVTIEAFVEAYETLGFVVCDDEVYEPAHEKIAIFTNELGEPTHAAIQLSDDKWSSKMGPFHDIRHPLRAVEGALYGRVTRFMKRQR